MGQLKNIYETPVAPHSSTQGIYCNNNKCEKFKPYMFAVINASIFFASL